MTGLDEFIGLFGKITVGNAVQFMLAAGFLFLIYRKVRDYLIQRHDADQERDANLKEALDAVRKYPEYRQQSIKIQHDLEEKMQSLHDAQEEIARRLADMENDSKRRERNKLRDRLIQNYRYYTSKEHNPGHAWSRMEADAFWESFRDYEAADGDGYIHTVVQPEMDLLEIVEMDDADGIAALMGRRK